MDDTALKGLNIHNLNILTWVFANPSYNLNAKVRFDIILYLKTWVKN